MVYLCPQTYGILKFVEGACGPDSVRLTADSILEQCYEIWSDYRQSGLIHQVAGAGMGGQSLVRRQLQPPPSPPAPKVCLDAGENMPLLEVLPPFQPSE